MKFSKMLNQKFNKINREHMDPQGKPTEGSAQCKKIIVANHWKTWKKG